MRHGRLLLAAVMAAAAAVIPASAARADAPACTTTFTGAVSTAWELPGNWDDGVPTSTSIACWADDETVVVSTAGPIAWIVRGGELDITAGSFTLADPPADTYAWGSTLRELVQTGGTSSGSASSAYVADHAEWTGPSTVSLPMGGGALVVDGTGPTELAGTYSVDWGSVTITNPDFRTSGSPSMRVHGGLTLGAVVVQHVGPGQATFVASDEGGGVMQGPASGDFGFASDAYVGPVHVAPAATFHAGSIALTCGGPHGGSVACSEITGSGTVDARHISGAFGDADPNEAAQSGSVVGDALAPGLDTLHLVGPVTLDGGIRIAPSATSDGQSGHVEVSGGPTTFTGVATVRTSPDAAPPGPGTTFAVLTDADGVVHNGDGVYPAHVWEPAGTSTSVAVARAAATTTVATADSPTTRPDGSVDLTVTVSSAFATPTGSVLLVRDFTAGGPVGVRTAPVVDGVAHLTALAEDAGHPRDPASSTFTLAYLGDDGAPYGHAPSEVTVSVPSGAPQPTPSASPSSHVTNRHGSCAAPGGPKASKVAVKAGARFRLTGQVVLGCRDTVPYNGRPGPKRTRVDLTPRGKRAFLPGKLIGYLAVDPDRHVHGFVTIPKKTRPGRYAIHVYGASKVLAITVR